MSQLTWTVSHHSSAIFIWWFLRYLMLERICPRVWRGCSYGSWGCRCLHHCGASHAGCTSDAARAWAVRGPLEDLLPLAVLSLGGWLQLLADGSGLPRCFLMPTAQAVLPRTPLQDLAFACALPPRTGLPQSLSFSLGRCYCVLPHGCTILRLLRCAVWSWGYPGGNQVTVIAASLRVTHFDKARSLRCLQWSSTDLSLVVVPKELFWVSTKIQLASRIFSTSLPIIVHLLLLHGPKGTGGDTLCVSAYSLAQGKIQRVRLTIPMPLLRLYRLLFLYLPLVSWRFAARAVIRTRPSQEPLVTSANAGAGNSSQSACSWLQHWFPALLLWFAWTVSKNLQLTAYSG